MTRVGRMVGQVPRRWLFISLVTVLTSAGAAVAVAAVADAPDPPATTLPGADQVDLTAPINLPSDVVGLAKKALIDASPTLTASAPPVPQVQLSAAGSDVGNPATVQAVKDAVVHDLTVDQQVGDLVDGASYSPQQLSDRLQPLNNVYAPDVVGGIVSQRLLDISGVLADPTYERYGDARFVAETWQGVHTDGATATALVTGHTEYLVQGTWSAEQPIQEQLRMTLVAGSWLIESVEGVPANDEAH